MNETNTLPLVVKKLNTIPIDTPLLCGGEFHLGAFRAIRYIFYAKWHKRMPLLSRARFAKKTHA